MHQKELRISRNSASQPIESHVRSFCPFRVVSSAVFLLLCRVCLAKGDDEKTNEMRDDVYANRAACNVQLYEPVKVC